MRERPILFGGPMVRALLDSTKTQTRRVVKGITPDIELAMDNNPGLSLALDDDGYGGLYQAGRGAVFSIPLPRCPFGAPGSRLWVRETWQYADWTEDGEPYIRYAADGTVRGFFGNDAPEGEALVDVWEKLSRSENYEIDNKAADRKWRPSIFMPSWASRITLDVTDVRVERLHEISAKDAEAEGLVGWSKDGKLTKYGVADPDGMPGSDYPGTWPWHEWRISPVDAYQRLWESINGDGSWDDNPWVWVVSFRRVVA